MKIRSKALAVLIILCLCQLNTCLTLCRKRTRKLKHRHHRNKVESTTFTNYLFNLKKNMVERLQKANEMIKKNLVLVSSMTDKFSWLFENILKPAGNTFTVMLEAFLTSMITNYCPKISILVSLASCANNISQSFFKTVANPLNNSQQKEQHYKELDHCTTSQCYEAREKLMDTKQVDVYKQQLADLYATSMPEEKKNKIVKNIVNSLADEYNKRISNIELIRKKLQMAHGYLKVYEKFLEGYEPNKENVDLISYEKANNLTHQIYFHFIVDKSVHPKWKYEKPCHKDFLNKKDLINKKANKLCKQVFTFLVYQKLLQQELKDYYQYNIYLDILKDQPNNLNDIKFRIALRLPGEKEESLSKSTNWLTKSFESIKSKMNPSADNRLTKSTPNLQSLTVEEKIDLKTKKLEDSFSEYNISEGMKIRINQNFEEKEEGEDKELKKSGIFDKLKNFGLKAFEFLQMLTPCLIAAFKTVLATTHGIELDIDTIEDKDVNVFGNDPLKKDEAIMYAILNFAKNIGVTTFSLVTGGIIAIVIIAVIAGLIAVYKHYEKSSLVKDGKIIAENLGTKAIGILFGTISGHIIRHFIPMPFCTI